MPFKCKVFTTQTFTFTVMLELTTIRLQVISNLFRSQVVLVSSLAI